MQASFELPACSTTTHLRDPVISSEVNNTTSLNCVAHIPARGARDDSLLVLPASNNVYAQASENEQTVSCGLFTSPLHGAESVFSVSDGDSDVDNLCIDNPVVNAVSCSQLCSDASTSATDPAIDESRDLSSLQCLAANATFDPIDVKTKVGATTNRSKQTLLRNKSRNMKFLKVVADTDGGHERLLMRTDDFVLVYDGGLKSYVDWFIIGGRFTRNMSHNRLLSKLDQYSGVEVAQYRGMFERFEMDVHILSALVRAYLG